MSSGDQLKAAQQSTSGSLWSGSSSKSSAFHEMVQQMEALKKAKEEYMMRSSGAIRLEDKDQIVKAIKDKVIVQEQYLEALKRKAKFIEENLQYSPGDIVVHTKYGNSVIQEIILGKDSFDYSRDWDLHEDGTPVETIGYKIAHGKGRALVKPEELIPYNEASKLLFEKK